MRCFEAFVCCLMLYQTPESFLFYYFCLFHAQLKERYNHYDPNKNSWILFSKHSFLVWVFLNIPCRMLFFHFGCLRFENSATNKQIRLIFFLKLFDSIEIIDWRCSAMLSWSDCSKWPYKGIKRQNVWWMGKDVILLIWFSLITWNIVEMDTVRLVVKGRASQRPHWIARMCDKH